MPKNGKTMFKPKITKEWLLATMELEGDGFCNAGGICSDTLDSNEVNDLPGHHEVVHERNLDTKPPSEMDENVNIGN